jgi:FkbM family methyltransferase
MLKELIPQTARNHLRTAFDSVFCENFTDKETLGNKNQWTILKRTLGRGSIVYSGGVGGDISFELALIERFGAVIHIFDPSPVAVPTIQRALTSASMVPSHLFFKPVGLSGLDTSRFSVGGGNGSETWFKAGSEKGDLDIPCTSISQQMRGNGHKQIDLLKLDIEGFEYGVLDSCIEENVEIKQICVEFHHFYEGISYLKTARSLAKLRKRGFKLIHKNRFDYTFCNASYLC